MDAEQIEELICLVAAMDRDAVLEHLHDFPATFPLDFTDEFLQTVSLDRLRHIFVALCLQSRHMPMTAASSAAA